MSDTAGSNRSLQIEGIPFRIAADANLSKILTKYENSMIPTSGISMRKVIRRTTALEGLIIIANGAEQENLKSFAESLNDLQINYTTAGCDTYRTVGTISIDAAETEENRVNTTVHPRDDWKAYIAE